MRQRWFSCILADQDVVNARTRSLPFVTTTNLPGRLFSIVAQAFCSRDRCADAVELSILIKITP